MPKFSDQVDPDVSRRQLVALRAAGAARQLADIAEMMALAVSAEEQELLLQRFAVKLRGARELNGLITAARGIKL